MRERDPSASLPPPRDRSPGKRRVSLRACERIPPPIIFSLPRGRRRRSNRAGPPNVGLQCCRARFATRPDCAGSNPLYGKQELLLSKVTQRSRLFRQAATLSFSSWQVPCRFLYFSNALLNLSILANLRTGSTNGSAVGRTRPPPAPIAPSGLTRVVSTPQPQRSRIRHECLAAAGTRGADPSPPRANKNC